MKIYKSAWRTGIGENEEEHDAVEEWFDGGAGEFLGERLAVFLEPAPGMVEDDGAAVEEEREDWRTGKPGFAVKQGFEEGKDAGHVGHEESEPEGGHEVKSHEPAEDGGQRTEDGGRRAEGGGRKTDF